MERTKLDFYFPKEIIDALDQLIEKGIYLDREEAIRDAMRHHFRQHGIEPFCSKVAEKPESSG